jgi:hypothetical protein
MIEVDCWGLLERDSVAVDFDDSSLFEALDALTIVVWASTIYVEVIHID